MKINKTLVTLTILSLAATIYIYDNLPDQIPIHWGIDGEIDRYGARFSALITGALPLLIYFLMHIIPKIDPRKDNYEKHMVAYKNIMTMLIVFLVGLHWAVMAYSLGYPLDVVFVVKLGAGLVFIGIGNYLPVVKHNFTLGIRLPWTLADEVVWEKTHRVGGYGFVSLGILWIVFSFFNEQWIFLFLMGSLFIFMCAITVYSYLIFSKRKQKNIQ